MPEVHVQFTLEGARCPRRIEVDVAFHFGQWRPARLYPAASDWGSSGGIRARREPNDLLIEGRGFFRPMRSTAIGDLDCWTFIAAIEPLDAPKARVIYACDLGANVRLKRLNAFEPISDARRLRAEFGSAPW
jgi:hypothetical protein